MLTLSRLLTLILMGLAILPAQAASFTEHSSEDPERQAHLRRLALRKEQLRCRQAFNVPHPPLSNTALEAFLTTTPIERTQMVNLKDFLEDHGIEFNGTTESYLVTFANGIKAVFKPDPNAPRLWSAVGERAAYIYSERLKVHLVPPTVIRTIGDQTGSLQYFLEWSLAADEVSYRQRLKQLPPQKRAIVDLFLFTIQQWDIHPGNLLISADSEEVGTIDNAMIMMEQYSRYGEMPFVKRSRHVLRSPEMIRSQTFPFDQVRTFQVEAPYYLNLTDKFEDQLQETYIKNLAGQIRGGLYKNNALPYVYWNDALWIQLQRWEFGPLQAVVYPPELIAEFKTLSFAELRGLLPRQYPDLFLQNFLHQVEQVLRAASQPPSR